MGFIYLIPNWFFGFSIVMELLFAFVTALVASYSFRISRLSQQNRTFIFGLSFLLIAISYLIKASINLFVIREIQGGFHALTFESLNQLGQIGIYAHTFLFIAGLLTLTYTTLRVQSRRTYTLMLLMAATAIYLAPEIAWAHHAISSILLAYITFFYVVEYVQKKNPRTFLVTTSFFGLLLSGIWSLFGMNFYSSYVIGHIIELVSYLLIATSLVLVIKKR